MLRTAVLCDAFLETYPLSLPIHQFHHENVTPHKHRSHSSLRTATASTDQKNKPRVICGSLASSALNEPPSIMLVQRINRFLMDEYVYLRVHSNKARCRGIVVSSMSLRVFTATAMPSLLSVWYLSFYFDLWTVEEKLPGAGFVERRTFRQTHRRCDLARPIRPHIQIRWPEREQTKVAIVMLKKHIYIVYVYTYQHNMQQTHAPNFSSQSIKVWPSKTSETQQPHTLTHPPPPPPPPASANPTPRAFKIVPPH